MEIAFYIFVFGIACFDNQINKNFSIVMNIDPMRVFHLHGLGLWNGLLRIIFRKFVKEIVAFHYKNVGMWISS